MNGELEDVREKGIVEEGMKCVLIVSENGVMARRGVAHWRSLRLGFQEKEGEDMGEVSGKDRLLGTNDSHHAFLSF